jgi:surface protein
MMKMKIKLFILLFLAVLPLTLWAEKVTREQALKTATEFMSDKTFTVAKSSRRVPGASSKDEPFYVFNASEGGFVIVSGDDRTCEILGYSPTGTLEMDRLPANLQWWLDEYARQIEGLGTTTVAVKTSLKASTASDISPLIHTQWNQYTPYNLMCPDGNGRDYNESGYDASNRCITGCVATAMAQVMNYWQWPMSCPELPGYTTKTNNYAIKALPSTTFKWTLMKNNYSYGETGEAANAVAELMRYCGQAVEMDYTTTESRAGVSRKVMVETFNYGHAISVIYRDRYDLGTWETIIYKELAEGRPVLYSGQSENSGHEFIVDGYASDGLFHINWGWGGHQDNYFVLSVADPSKPGTAGASSSGGYKNRQSAMIGIKPFREGEVEPYAALSDDGLTVTFYYDGHMLSRKGVDIGYNSKKGQTPYATATTAVFDDSFTEYYPYNTSEWFRGCLNLKEIKGISNLNTEYVTNMSFMFYECSSLTNLDVSGFKTDNVTNMSFMFYECSSLTNLDVSGFKTDNVTSMSRMFDGCSSLTNLDVSGFKTDNVTSMSCMFDDCSSLMNLDVSGFKTDNVTSMSCMFYNCSSLTNLDVSGFKTDNVTSMNCMFYNCSNLTSLDLSGFKSNNEKDMRYMFYNCSSLTSLDLSGFKTDSVTNMSFMFYGCSNLTNLDLSGFKTDSVTNMSSMFYNCSSLTNLDLSGFKTDNVTSMGCMFYNCSSLTSLDLSGFKTENVTSMYCMFYNCSSLTSLDLSGFKTDSVTNMSCMFYGCSSLTTIYACDVWNTEKVTLDEWMFYNCTNLVGGKGTEYDLSRMNHTYARIDGGTDAPGYFTYKASTDIKGITVDSTIDGYAPIYDIGGRRLAAPKKGVNIVRMSDGTTKKILTK